MLVASRKGPSKKPRRKSGKKRRRLIFIFQNEQEHRKREETRRRMSLGLGLVVGLVVVQLHSDDTVLATDLLLCSKHTYYDPRSEKK